MVCSSSYHWPYRLYRSGIERGQSIVTQRLAAMSPNISSTVCAAYQGASPASAANDRHCSTRIA